MKTTIIGFILPGIKDLGVPTAKYVHDRFEAAGVDEDILRDMARSNASEWTQKQLFLGNKPTLMSFHDDFPVWSDERYVDLLEATIDIEIELFAGRRRTH